MNWIERASRVTLEKSGFCLNILKKTLSSKFQETIVINAKLINGQ